jgi:hypothetical protein
MPLSTTRTPPQRSFGRRAGATAAQQPTVSLSAPPVAVSVEPVQDLLPGLAAPVEPTAARTVEAPAETPAETTVAVARPSAVPQPTESLSGNLTALGVVRRSLAVIARNPVTFLALVAAVALTEQLAVYFPVSAGVPAWLLLPLLTTMACMALYAAAFHTAMSSLKGERVNFDLSLRAMATTPQSAYGAMAATVSSLSLLLILPAIGFAWRWVLAAPAAIVEGGDARARGLALATPYRAQIRLLVWLLAGLSLLRGFLSMLLSPQSILSGLTGDWLFPMLLTVLTAVTSAVLYRELTSPT